MHFPFLRLFVEIHMRLTDPVMFLQPETEFLPQNLIVIQLQDVLYAVFILVFVLHHMHIAFPLQGHLFCTLQDFVLQPAFCLFIRADNQREIIFKCPADSFIMHPCLALQSFTPQAAWRLKRLFIGIPALVDKAPIKIVQSISSAEMGMLWKIYIVRGVFCCISLR